MMIAVTAAVLASAACVLLGMYCLYLKNKIKNFIKTLDFMQL